MKEINLHNYEEFLLDYSEGVLNNEEIQSLKGFLLINPSLNIDLETIELTYLEKENNLEDFKTNLYKNINDSNALQIVKYIEGELDEIEKLKFEIEVGKNPLLAKELDLYKKTILLPEESITFPLKNVLQKENDNLLLSNLSIAYFENQLSEIEKLNFEKEIDKNFELKNELNLISKTKLIYDSTIVYPYKNKLLKETKVFFIFNYIETSAIAAAVVLLIGLSILFNFNSPQPEVSNSLAVKKDSLRYSKITSKSTKDKINYKKSEKVKNEQKKLIALKSDKKIDSDKVEIKKADEEINIEIENDVVKTPIEDKNRNTDIHEILPENEVVATNNQEIYKKQTILIEEEDTELNEENTAITNNANSKPSFWKRAVTLAKQAKNLGLKNIEAEEKNNNFILAFNNLSVEKK